MEKEDALKAGHWVDPVRGMQLWSAAGGINNAMAVRRAVAASDAISFGFQNAQWVVGEEARALPY